MSESLNERLIEKINKSDYGKNIKDFLKSILLIELVHLEERTMRYGKEYDRCIMKHMNEEGE